MSKLEQWQQWYESLSPSTREYLDSQAIWHDSDMVKSLLVGVVVGIIIGALVWAI